jgi:hypothetical protein
MEIILISTTRIIFQHAASRVKSLRLLSIKLSKYLLSTSYIPGTVLGSEDPSLNKNDLVSSQGLGMEGDVGAH